MGQDKNLTSKIYKFSQIGKRLLWYTGDETPQEKCTDPSVAAWVIYNTYGVWLCECKWTYLEERVVNFLFRMKVSGIFPLK